MLRNDTKVADMTDDQIKQMKAGLDQAAPMIDRMREMMGDDIADKLKTTAIAEQARLKPIPKEQRDPETVQRLVKVNGMLERIGEYRAAAERRQKKREEEKRRKEEEKAELALMAERNRMREEQENAVKRLYKLRWDLAGAMKMEFDAALEKVKAPGANATEEMLRNGEGVAEMPWVAALKAALEETGKIDSLKQNASPQKDPITKMTYEEYIASFVSAPVAEEAKAEEAAPPAAACRCPSACRPTWPRPPWPASAPTSSRVMG